MLKIRTVPLSAAIVALGVCNGWGADRMLKIVPADGSSMFIKAFQVPANTTITGVTFESNAAGNTFPEISLAEGPAASVATAMVLRTAIDVSPGSAQASLTWTSPVTTTASGTYYVAIRLPAQQATPAALAAGDIAAPNGSYVVGGAEDTMLPLKADLGIQLTTSGSGPAKADGSSPQPKADVLEEALTLDVHSVMSAGTAKIFLSLPRPTEVSLDIYDVSGRKIRAVFRGMLDAGLHVQTWDSRDDRGHEVARGLYLVRVLAGGSSLTTKLPLAR